MGRRIPLSRNREGAWCDEKPLIDIGAAHRLDEWLDRGGLKERAIPDTPQGRFLSFANHHPHQPQSLSQFNRMEQLVALPLKGLPYELIDQLDPCRGRTTWWWKTPPVPRPPACSYRPPPRTEHSNGSHPHEHPPPARQRPLRLRRRRLRRWRRFQARSSGSRRRRCRGSRFVRDEAIGGWLGACG